MDGEIKKLRSENWFNDPTDAGMTAIYMERYLNYGLTREELQSAKPIIGIAQIGSDLTPCNRGHLETVKRVRDGVYASGGIPIEFPVHPIQESCRRPTAALDRNLAYLGLVEILHGYPFDGVVLTTGCDKTTPACLMAAATVNIPSIVLSGGPMLDGWHNGALAGSGTMLWEGRKSHAQGQLSYEEFIEQVAASSPSAGHCNTMGTALSMNCMAEALGMSLPGCASIPAPYRERLQMSYRTGVRIVEMITEDLRPSKVLTRQAFENAVVVNSALGGSTNCPIHLTAIARHAGVELSLQDWQDIGYEIPLLVNCQPAGEYLGEAFHRAGGVPAVLNELAKNGKINTNTLTVSGGSVAKNISEARLKNDKVIKRFESPLREKAGFLVLSGNLFDGALIKTSVISEDFRFKYLSNEGQEGCFTARCIVFEGPEDYHARIDDPELSIDESCMLVIRGCGPIGYPGSAEVVNMQPPAELIKAGIGTLPTMGDGRQSGTAASPSILNISPESAIGSNFALLETGDNVTVDLNKCEVNLLVNQEELEKRRSAYVQPKLEHQTPWQEIYRSCVGQLSTGGCLELATKYHNVGDIIPRRNH